MYNLAQNQACITLRPALLGEVPEGRRGKGELKWKHFEQKKTARRSEPFCVKYSLRLEAEYSYEISRECRLSVYAVLNPFAFKTNSQLAYWLVIYASKS